MTGQAVLVCATAYEPTDVQLHGLLAQLAAISSDPWVFDNSSPSTRVRVAAACQEFGVGHLAAPHNVGIAGALNWAVEHARGLGREWVLYFDQDSRLADGAKAREWSKGPCVPDSVGLVACQVFLGRTTNAEASASPRYKSIEASIASGSMFRVAAVRELGGFDEELALDGVDHEACLGLRELGWSLVRDSERSIVHAIGEDSRSVPFLRRELTKHPWWRRRAMWKSCIVITRRYAHFDAWRCWRYVGGRLLESVQSAVYFRDARYLVTAAQGVCDGLGARRERRRFLDD